MTQIPDRLNIVDGERELYDKIDIFKDKSRKEQFLFAMAFGYKNNVHLPLETREGFFLTKDMRLEDEALMNAIAINKKDSVEVLSSIEDVFQIAEEYAHAGIKLLYDKINSTQFGSFDKQFEKELLDIYNELDLGEDGEKNTSG